MFNVIKGAKVNGEEVLAVISPAGEAIYWCERKKEWIDFNEPYSFAYHQIVATSRKSKV